MFVTHADAAAQAILTISMAAAAVVEYVPALILVAIGLGAFGIAAGLAAIGTGLLGAALVILGLTGALGQVCYLHLIFLFVICQCCAIWCCHISLSSATITQYSH